MQNHKILTSFQKFSPLAKSSILLSSGVFIFGFADNLTLFISDKVSVGQFHFSRSVIACIVVLIICYLNKEILLPKNWMAVIIRTLVNTLAMLLYFSSIPMMPIAEAGAGLFTSPIFVLIFSFIFFKENISGRQVISFFFGFVGVVMILGTNFANFSYYHFLPVMAGFTYAVGVILTNRYCHTENSLVLLLFFLISIGFAGLLIVSYYTLFPVDEATLSQAPFIFRSWQPVDINYWLIISVVGISGALAIFLMIQAYQICRPTYSSIYEYAYLISAGLFGWFLWNELPTIWSLIGIMLIVAAGANITLSQVQTRK